MLMVDWIDFGIGIVAIAILALLASYLVNKITAENNPDILEDDEERNLFDDVHDKGYKNKYETTDNTYQPDIEPYHPVYNPDGYGAGMTNTGFIGK